MMGSGKMVNENLKAGQQLARYKIVRKLSSGGFGVVYLARRDDGHLVALKEFLPSVISCRLSTDGPNIQCRSEYDNIRFQDGLRAFFREADTLAQVHNPRIIPIWDVFKENGTAYFAMPVERGGTLQNLVRLRPQALDEVSLRHIFVDACKGVEALHQKGLLHLDIKPSNLWVRPDRSVIVLDLGASRWGDEEMKSSQMARTPGFAAPEQHSVFRDRGLSPRTDIYGLCASFLSCLDQAPPVAASFRRPGDRSPSWSRIGQASPDLLRVIETGMAMQPQFRQADVAALREELERAPRLMASSRWPETLSKATWTPSSAP